MTNEDRIADLERRVGELEQKPGRKKKPHLTDAETAEVHTRFGPVFQGDLTAIDGLIYDALDHDAAKKRGNGGSWFRYVCRWIEDEAKKMPKQQPVVAVNKYSNQNVPQRQRA